MSTADRIISGPGRLYVRRGDGWIELGTTAASPQWSAVIPDEDLTLGEVLASSLIGGSQQITFHLSQREARTFRRAYRWSRSYVRPLCINGAEYHRRARARRRRHR